MQTKLSNPHKNNYYPLRKIGIITSICHPAPTIHIQRHTRPIRVSLSDNSAANHLIVSSIPDSELTGSDAPLRGVEKNVQRRLPHQERGVLEGLTVAYPYSHPAHFPGLEFQVRSYPMQVLKGNPEAAAGESGVPVTLPDIDYVFVYICGNHEDGIAVPTDVQPLSLTYGVEMRPVVTAHYFGERILLVAGFLDVFPAAAVGLGLEMNGRVVYLSAQAIQLVVAESGKLFHIPVAYALASGPLGLAYV